jgi:hypothetical protein
MTPLIEAWRSKIEGLTDKSSPEDAQDVQRWFAEGLTAGSEVQLQYRLGRFLLGADLRRFLWAFDEMHLGKGEKAEEQAARRRRAYHFLLDGMLANYEYSMAHEVRRKLKESGESVWLRWRHFILWRLAAAAVAGNIALGGSSHWLHTTLEFAAVTCWWGVAFVSTSLLVLPAVATEYFQAPTHVLRNKGELFRRLMMVLLNAVCILLAIAVAQWGLVLAYAGPRSGWRDFRIHVMMAAVSVAIGYAVNLIWRDRSIAGPAA